MKAYEKYKNSGFDWVEKIPSHWEVWPFKHHYRFEKGKNAQKYTQDYIGLNSGEHPVYSGQTENEGVMGTINSYEYAFNEPVLFSTTVGAKAMTLIALNGKFSLSQNCALFYLRKKNRLDFKYGFYYTQRLFDYEKGLIALSMQPSLRFEDLQKYSILIPPLPEQRQIAAYLDYKTNQIDRFITNRKKQIELLEEQVASHINRVMSEGIKRNPEKQPTGIPYLPEIPAHWDLRKFIGLTKILTCGLASTPEYVNEEEGVPFLSAQNCRPFRMDLSKYNYIKPELHKQLTKYKKPEKGDVLVTRVGAGIGQACVIDTDLEFSVYVSLTHIRPTKEILSEYIVYFFNTEYSRQLNYEGTVVGGGQGNLNVNNVAKYKIPLPPVDEQTEIVNYLDEKRQEIGELISKYQKQIDLMQEYKTSLISKAVTGKIDVREWQPKQILKETV